MDYFPDMARVTVLQKIESDEVALPMVRLGHGQKAQRSVNVHFRPRKCSWNEVLYLLCLWLPRAVLRLGVDLASITSPDHEWAWLCFPVL